MKNYSLVRKLGSSFGLVTLSGSIISGISAGKAFADGEFIKSKLFVALCNFFSDDKLKTLIERSDEFFSEQEKDADKNIEKLKNKKLWSLIKLWKFSENVIKNEKLRKKTSDNQKLAQKFKTDLETVLRGDLNEKVKELLKSKEFKDNINFIFKDIKSDAKTMIEILDASTYKDLFFEKDSGLYIKGSLEKYFRAIKDLYDNYFRDSSMYGHEKFVITVGFIETCEFVQELLEDSLYIEKLDHIEINARLITYGKFCAELLHSKFCSKEEIVRIFSIFADRLPTNKPLCKTVENMSKLLKDDKKFVDFIDSFALAFSPEGRKIENILNTAFAKDLEKINGIFSNKKFAENFMNAKYGGMFSNLKLHFSNDEGAFFTANVKK